MGLFKDFSQAVNELVPGGNNVEEPVTTPVVEEPVQEEVVVEDTTTSSALDELLESVKEEQKMRERKDLRFEERKVMDTPVVENQTINASVVSDETSVITAGTVLTGDIATTGSVELQGTINGNVSCNGKLVVTGTINGNSTSAEFFADVAKIEGEVVSTGTVKIGSGSVIIGNITAASAVIAGAVKGDIDVQGPVVVDASAVIMGNIKSRSVQINNGAVIEGFCSQAYADVDVAELFGRR